MCDDAGGRSCWTDRYTTVISPPLSVACDPGDATKAECILTVLPANHPASCPLGQPGCIQPHHANDIQQWFDAGMPQGPPPTWDAEIQPVSQQYCRFCHSAAEAPCDDGQAQSCWVDSYSSVSSAPLSAACDAGDATRAECVITLLTLGHPQACPLGGNNCIQQPEAYRIMSWVGAGIPEN